MEVRKQKPSVMIQVYSASSGPNRHGKLEREQEQHQHQHQEQQQSNEDSTIQLTRSDRSTNLFNWRRLKPKQTTGINLDQIKGPSGSVRGHRDVVKRSLENIKVAQWATSAASSLANRNFMSLNMPSFTPISSVESARTQMDEQMRLECVSRLMEEEQDQCVAYTTTLGVIRRTFDDSKLMRSILELNLIKYQERDVYLNQEYKCQLRLRCSTFSVPVLFVDGRQFGGIKELESLNENGGIGKMLAKFKMSKVAKDTCSCCGNARFIACQSCNGSRRSAIHHFRFNSVALRCIRCDRNEGLVRCPACSDETQLEEEDENNNFM